MKKIWPFSFYFIYFAAIATYAPYMVLYYRNLEFSGAQIGTLTGITPLIALLSVPLWTGIADRTNRHKLVMSLCMLVGIACLFILPSLRTFTLVLSLAVLSNFFFPAVSAFADNASMTMLEGHKDLIGRVRLGGTIGFGITATLAGILVEDYGLKFAFWGGGAIFFLGFLVSRQLGHGKGFQKGSSPKGGVIDLLKNHQWLLFLTAAFTCGFAFAATNTYLFPYMDVIGVDESLMGIALTVSTVAEIPIFIFANRLFKRFDSFKLLLFSMIMTGLRLLLFAIAPGQNFILFVMLLNGFAHPLTWIAGVTFADENAPEGYRATAQGLFSSVGMGLGGAVGGFTGGLIFENIGSRALYWIFGGIIFGAFAFVWIARKSLQAKDPHHSASF
jgi:PPP family 3-phenylpropionic acid transporter